MSDLKNQLIKLGSAYPELRPHIQGKAVNAYLKTLSDMHTIVTEARFQGSIEDMLNRMQEKRDVSEAFGLGLLPQSHKEMIRLKKLLPLQLWHALVLSVVGHAAREMAQKYKKGLSLAAYPKDFGVGFWVYGGPTSAIGKIEKETGYLRLKVFLEGHAPFTIDPKFPRMTTITNGGILRKEGARVGKELAKALVETVYG